MDDAEFRLAMEDGTTMEMLDAAVEQKRKKSQAENEAQRLANEEAKRREEEERKKREEELAQKQDRDDFGNRPQGPFGFWENPITEQKNSLCQCVMFLSEK